MIFYVFIQLIINITFHNPVYGTASFSVKKLFINSLIYTSFQRNYLGEMTKKINLGSRKNIPYPFCNFLLPFCGVVKILVTLRGNFVFDTLHKNKIKSHFWVSYLFPTPLFFLLILGISWSHLMAQQDPMFTKYMFNSQVFNPAYAGSKDFFSANVLLREQWVGLGQSSFGGNSDRFTPSTQTFALQTPVTSRISLGLTVINDRIGARNSSTANFVYAYHFPFAKGELSLGLQAGLINWRADWSKLNFKDPQFLDPIYAESNPTRLVPNVGVGLYYYSDKFYAGFSIPHVIENDLRDITPSDLQKSRNIDRFYRHYYFMTGAAIELIGKSLVFKPSLLIKNVGLLSDFSANQQTISQVGAPTEFDIDLSLFFNEVFWIGVSYRSAFEVEAFGGPSSNDSADVWFSFFLNNGMRIGAAYDFTLTGLRQNISGSFELMVGYDLDFKVRKVNTPRYF